DLPPVSSLIQPTIASPLREKLYYHAVETLHKAIDLKDYNSILWKEEFVILSGIWSLFSSKSSDLFDSAVTAEAMAFCYMTDLETRNDSITPIIQSLMSLVVEDMSREHTEKMLDVTYDLQAKYPESRNFIKVLEIILKNIIKPLHGQNSPSEADAILVWASIFRDGLPLNTLLDLCLGEQGCSAANLSKSQLANIFNVETTVRKCDCILKVGKIEVGNFEAKRRTASQVDVMAQRLKNIKINKSIALEMEKLGMECPPLLNIHGTSASVFRVRKFRDIWVAGKACSAIVLPTTFEEIPFFLEEPVYILFNLLNHYNEYAKLASKKQKHFFYRKKEEIQDVVRTETENEKTLEWDRVVFHTPSRPNQPKKPSFEINPDHLSRVRYGFQALLDSDGEFSPPQSPSSPSHSILHYRTP
ncbi:hypothetical protein BGX20_004803, partial [Mortierella sp. AD010]